MSVKIQVIVDEEEAVKFRSQAKRELKSLSAWLREAGKERLVKNKNREVLTDPESLNNFFNKINTREKGVEPNWEEHKKLIETGYGQGHTP